MAGFAFAIGIAYFILFGVAMLGLGIILLLFINEGL